MVKTNRKSGFTIVELLIVIVVIGILAALVITTFSGIQQKARDTKRQTDIKALHSQLEAFFAANAAGYPVLADVNSATWRATNMKGFDSSGLCAPSNSNQTNCTLKAGTASEGSGEQYGYATLNADNSTCDTAAGTTCAKYTLTADLEGQINGSGTYTKNSLN
jgi:prepilin-type N-terminal cleavage/methylation domain-containing protein